MAEEEKLMVAKEEKSTAKESMAQVEKKLMPREEKANNKKLS